MCLYSYEFCEYCMNSHTELLENRRVCFMTIKNTDARFITQALSVANDSASDMEICIC
jgi:hypothetical protein